MRPAVFAAASVLAAAFASAAGADEPPLKIVAVGDIAFTDMVTVAMTRGQDPFGPLASVLSGADFTFGNLESVLASKRRTLAQERPGIPLLVAPPWSAGFLAHAGFDLLSVANNHAMDADDVGMVECLHALWLEHLESIGAGSTKERATRAFIKTIRGVRVGWLAFTFGLNQNVPITSSVARLDSAAARSIAALRPKVDVLLVSLHWGQEFKSKPAPHHVKLAHQLIEAGADAIIGHHPHVLQSIEVYRGHPVIYSLGNFVFGPQPGARGESMVLELTASKSGVVRARVLPVTLSGTFGFPRAASSADAARITASLQSYSRYLGTSLTTGPDGWVTIRIP